VPVIGLIAVTGGGRAAAQRLADAWPGQTRRYDGPTRQALPRAWAECDGLVCFLAVGATVRLIAPLLDSKWTDPAVVCVDESARRAVAVVGGHAAGANALAARVAAVFGADAVITTATDAENLPGLDSLGWPTEGASGTVSRALLDGERVRLESAHTWPLPPLPDTVGEVGEYRILISDRAGPPDPRTAVVRPPSLVIGVHAAPGAAAEDVLRLADNALAEAELSPASVAALAAVLDGDAPDAGPAITEAAQQRGWPVRTYPASGLAARGAAGRDPARRAAAGIRAAGRAAAGSGARRHRPAALNGALRPPEVAALAAADELVVPERSTEGTSVAVARIWPRGRIALIGTGPGPADLLTPRALAELRRASVLAGLGRSLDHVGDLLRPGTRILPGAGNAAACGQEAIRQARLGHAVAITFPADPGMHEVAGLVLSQAGADIDVVEVPGVTAALAASAVLGAPLGGSNAVISPGEHTSWAVTEAQVRAAAEAGFVLTVCLPPGKSDEPRLDMVLAVLRQYRAADTPVAVVRDAHRADQQVSLSTLGALEACQAGEQSIIIVGTASTRVVAGRMITLDDG
jgi:cobalt-precorrin 5A hydrolase / cobalt-factor III methyltransferase / precorrin-3B C17-methyltransferase